MSSEVLPITPARFAEALKDLSLSSLHLKVLEIRNSIAHLDYSNEQLRPFAQGTAATLDAPTPAAGAGAGAGTAGPQPDQDCIDAIRENEEVIARMQERIRMVRDEVEGRGCSWAEFRSKEEMEADEQAAASGAGDEVVAAAEGGLTNRAATGHTRPVDGWEEAAAGTASGGNGRAAHQAWSDGTFQTGTIRNGEVHMDTTNATQGGGGGRLTDEQLRRALEERLGLNQDDDDEEGGMHL